MFPEAHEACIRLAVVRRSQQNPRSRALAAHLGRSCKLATLPGAALLRLLSHVSGASARDRLRRHRRPLNSSQLAPPRAPAAVARRVDSLTLLASATVFSAPCAGFVCVNFFLQRDHSEDEWFRHHVIQPAYNIAFAMQQYVRNNGSLKDHPKRPNYDDLNEYFWNRRWLDHNKNYHDEDAQFFWGKKYNKGFLIDLDPKTGKVNEHTHLHDTKHAARTAFLLRVMGMMRSHLRAHFPSLFVFFCFLFSLFRCSCKKKATRLSVRRKTAPVWC